MNQPTRSAATGIPTRLGPLHLQTIGSGPPAVLWHSLFVDSTTWARVRQPLAGMRRLVLIDGPAHGHNPPVPHRFSLEDCVGAALDVLDGRRIVLLRWLYRLAGPVPPLVNLLVDALLGPQARDEDPQGATLVADAFRRADRRGMQATIGWLSLGRPDLAPVLDRLDTPTLLTTGTNDPMWTTTDARAAAAHLANGALVILPGAGHIGPLLQAAPAVVELVGAFWHDPAATIAHHPAATAPTSQSPAG